MPERNAEGAKVTDERLSMRPTLRAFIATLLPDDEYGPGGLAAGVDRYVASLWETSDAIASTYEQSLVALDTHAKQRSGAPFADLDLATRTAIVEDLEAGTAAGSFVPDPATFFAMAHHHVLEGMFGDPIHGGNRELIGWKLMGYHGIKPVATAEDQRIGAPPEHPVRSLQGVRPDAVAP